MTTNQGLPVNFEMILYRLDKIAEEQKNLVEQLRDDRRTYTDTFVRKDVYLTQHQAQTDDIEAIETRLDKQDTFRKQVLSGISIGVVLLMINFAIALSNFMARGAG